MIGGKENILYDKAYAFALRIVKAYQFLSAEKREYVLPKQLLRCGTSIGANVTEANGAISDAEIFIAYKECLETKYWLNLLHDTDFISTEMFDSIFQNADELGKMLFTTLRSTRQLHNKST